MKQILGWIFSGIATVLTLYIIWCLKNKINRIIELLEIFIDKEIKK